MFVLDVFDGGANQLRLGELEFSSVEAGGKVIYDGYANYRIYSGRPGGT